MIDQDHAEWLDKEVTRLRAENERLRAALRKAPIESAPRDRSVLLAWRDGWHVGRWIVASLVHGRDCWMMDGGTAIEPTHWAELPPVPNRRMTIFEALTCVERNQAVEACKIIKALGYASTPSVQRRLRLGYSAATRLMDCLEEEGIIGPPAHEYQRPIYMDKLDEALSTSNSAIRLKETP
jgi:hypothetical protein